MAVALPLAALVLFFQVLSLLVLVPLLSLLEAGEAFGRVMGVRHQVLADRFAVMASQQTGRAVALCLLVQKRAFYLSFATYRAGG